MIEQVINRAIINYKEIFRQNINALDRELIDRSPVDTGRFKSNWILRWYSPDTFKYSRVNNLPYALKLWRYHHSAQGWSTEGGDVMVQRHVNKMREEFEAENRRIVRA